MKKSFLKIFILLTISTLCMSHEFWLQPKKFNLQPSEKTYVDVFVGENYKGEKVDASKFMISKMTHYAKNIEEDFISKISTKDSVSIEAEFTTAGNHLLAFNNTNKWFVKSWIVLVIFPHSRFFKNVTHIVNYEINIQCVIFIKICVSIKKVNNFFIKKRCITIYNIIN